MQPLAQQQQVDAHAVLQAWPKYAGSNADSVSGSREALLFWQQAKASGEFTAAYAASLSRAAADPVADALLVDWGCWRPERHPAAMQQAEAWLASYPDSISESDHAWVAYVQARESWLGEQLATRELVEAAAGRAVLMTFVALVLALALASLGWVCARLLCRP